MRYIIYGPPGTGKTHTLLGHIESFLEKNPIMVILLLFKQKRTNLKIFLFMMQLVRF